MKIIKIEYNERICPNCGGAISRPGEVVTDELRTCYFSEIEDEGGGCIDYVVVCHNGEVE